MALLSELFGLPQMGAPQETPDEELLRRALRLNDGIVTGQAVANQPAVPPLDPVRELREYPVHEATAARETVPASIPQPQAAPQFMPREPSMGDRIGRFLMAGSPGSIARGIGEATYSADRASQTENATVAALMRRGGYGQDEALAIARNPAMLQSVLPSVFGPKNPYQKVAPGEALLKDGKPIFTNTEQKPSDVVKQYQFYHQDETAAGRPPKSFSEWDLSRRQAGATAVTIADKRERSFEAEAGKTQAKRFGEIIDQGNNAKAMLGDMRQLADIAKRVQTGPGAQLTAALGPFAQWLGVNIAGLSDIEAYKGIVDRLAPRMRAPGSGASSDFDARQFLSSLPNIGRSAAGNEIINRTFQAISETQIAAGEIASRVYAGEITPGDGERMLRELPDPFDAYKTWQKNNPPETIAPSGAQPDASGVWTDPQTGARVRRKN